MKIIQSLIFIWIIAILSLGSALAEEKVVPVAKDNSAPYTGLLVPEGRFTELLGSEIIVEQLRGELEIQKNLTINIEALYDERLREAVKPLRWYEKPSFNRWLGFGIGVIVTFLAIWGGNELEKAIK